MMAEAYADCILCGLIIGACGVVCLWAYRFGFLETKTLKVRYRLFALRDRLAMLAMKGVVDEDSDVYKHVLGLANAAIHSCETLDGRFFLDSIRREVSEEMMREHEKLFRAMRANPVMLEVYGGVMQCIYDALWMNSALVRVPALSVLFALLDWKARSERLKEQRRIEREIRERLDECADVWPTASAA